MRLLVLSDSHGRKNLLLEAVELHPEADAVIFLGDGERDIEFLKELHPEIKLYAVCGTAAVSYRKIRRKDRLCHPRSL